MRLLVQSGKYQLGFALKYRKGGEPSRVKHNLVELNGEARRRLEEQRPLKKNAVAKASSVQIRYGNLRNSQPLSYLDRRKNPITHLLRP